MRVLHERAAKIEGAHRERESLRAAAQEKDKAYREAIRAARAKIFAEQEAARRVALDERGAAVQRARAAAGEQIQTARARITKDKEVAASELELSSRQLAEEIARSVLGQRPLPSSGKVQ